MEELLNILTIGLACFGLYIAFHCICIVCDAHLVPAVEVIIQHFKIPEEVAAVTLVAFGSASPEILLNTVSVITDSSALSLPAALGSAMIAFGLVPPLCILFTSHEEVKLRMWPIVREILFFIAGLATFMYIIFDGTTTWREALLLTSMYFVYVFFVIVLYMRKSDQREEMSLEMTMRIDTSVSVSDEVSYSAIGYVWSVGECLHGVVSTIDAPLQHIINAVIPSLHRKHENVLVSDVEEGLNEEQIRNRKNSQQEEQDVSAVKVAVKFLCSVLSLGGCSVAVVYLSEILVDAFHLDRTTIGATVLALGSQLPDIVSSIALAKAGYFDGAMAGAIGSQVTSITLGVGMPGLMMCAYNNGHFHIEKSGGSLWLLTSLLMMIVGSYALFALPLSRCFYNYGDAFADSTVITRRGAYALIGAWVTAFAVYIIANEWH